MPITPIATYLIPVGEANLAERQQMRMKVDEDLYHAATKLRIRDSREDFVVRDTLPLGDLGLAATDDWLIPGPGVAGTDLQYFSSALAQDRCIIFYGVGVESANPGVSRLRLTLGAASTEVRGVFQLEQLYTRLEPTAYFNESILYVRTETARVMVLPRIAFAANTERLNLLARTIEPIGGVVSARSMA